jgi:hypothetical protein
MWDVPVISDRTVPANRPDTVLRVKKWNTCLLIDIALDDIHFNTNETEKNEKVRKPEDRVSKMWKLRTKIVPAITGELGTMKNGCDQNLQLLPGHSLAKELQKITLISTAHSSLKVLG